MTASFDFNAVSYGSRESAESSCLEYLGGMRYAEAEPNMRLFAARGWRPALAGQAMATSGALVAVQEVRRPDGAVLCSTVAGTVDCPLDASGLHTIVVRDSSGTATGGYNMPLTCLTGSCRAPVPPLTIGMTAPLTSGRLIRTLVSTITVANAMTALSSGQVTNTACVETDN